MPYCMNYLSFFILFFSRFCRRLEDASLCRAHSVTSCRSLQAALTVTYFENSLQDAINTCQDSTVVDLTTPVDVYSSSAECVIDFVSEVSAALMADEVAAPVCTAMAAFKDCPKELPDLTLEYVIGNMMDMVDAVAPQEVCDAVLGAAPGQSRSSSVLSFRFLLLLLSLSTPSTVIFTETIKYNKAVPFS